MGRTGPLHGVITVAYKELSPFRSGAVLLSTQNITSKKSVRPTRRTFLCDSHIIVLKQIQYVLLFCVQVSPDISFFGQSMRTKCF